MSKIDEARKDYIKALNCYVFAETDKQHDDIHRKITRYVSMLEEKIKRLRNLAGQSQQPPAESEKLKRSTSDPESKKWWDSVKEAAASAPKLKSTQPPAVDEVDMLKRKQSYEQGMEKTMTDDKLHEVINIYGYRLSNLRDPAFDHLRDMIPQMRDFVDEGRREKVMRWLGFVQGVLWIKGVVTLGELKLHNKAN